MSDTSRQLLNDPGIERLTPTDGSISGSSNGFYPFDWIPPEDIDPEIIAILSQSNDRPSDTDVNGQQAVADRPIHINGLSHLVQYIDDHKLNLRFSYIVETTRPDDIQTLPGDRTHNIVNLQRVNDVRHLNDFFETVNETIPPGGLFIGCAETLEAPLFQQKKTLPKWLYSSHYSLLFVLKRVLPKLKLTKKVYLTISKGKNRVISKAEILGRLIYCGFEIVNTLETEENMYFTVQKVQQPASEPSPTYGPIIKMKRIGKDGRKIEVYKFRTMHPYSEYLQAYVYLKNHLQQNGKFNDDFRVTSWGRKMRKVWMDEIPMLLNWLRRDVKFVGVRPLSEQYLSIYPKELVQKRIRYKPGLIPPYYADLPESFDEILSSEEKYLDAYERHPMRTDVGYFFRVAFNILVKRVRSQ